MAVFKEEVYMAPWIKWGTAGLMVFFVVIGLIGELGTGDTPSGQWVGMIIAMVGAALALALVFSIRLTWKIDSAGITYRMFPLEFKERKIGWEDVESLEIFKLKAFPGYGGFGRRRRPFQKEIAYILNRKYALRIQRKNGRKVVISTEKVRAVVRMLQAVRPELLKSLPEGVN